MVQYKTGDSIGDCPGCNSSESVIYRGANEGVCNRCGSTFEVSFEEDEQGEADPVEPTPAPAPTPAPRPQQTKVQVEEPQQVHIPEPVIPNLNPVEQAVIDRPVRNPIIATPDDIGKLTQSVAAPIKTFKQSLQLDPNIQSVAIEKAKEVGVPDYILKSRPWKWAHQMGKLGNPYRADSKNAIVYAALQERPMTVSELVLEMEPKLGDKISFLLIVYEVLTQCVAAGLLVMDEQTRKIGTCQGQPQPAKLP